MFETKLKIQKWWSNIKIRKNKDKTAQQVREVSAFGMLLGLFLKLLALTFFALIILFPFFFMLMISLMPETQAKTLQSSFSIIPKSLTWTNYSTAANTKANGNSDYWSAFALTFANVIFSIIVKIFITLFAGYAFSLKKWRGKNVLWAILMGLLILPEVALLSGQYKVVTEWNNAMALKNNFIGAMVIIAVPFVASIFNALMFKNAFESIPSRIKEVALVDGAAGAKYLFKIAIPMVTPTTLTVVILTALAAWNSYLWPSLALGSDYFIISTWLFHVGRDESSGVPIILQSIKMAGAVLVIIPMFIFYFAFRKRIMNAISRQGSTIKG
ncbi:carbohydrate ABC transporter permease [Mycoplasmopsis fermentans]|uniref:carbohydrate ABC transporter permease n=1 Tax=Mycoplasmopsis fermentans TaxID=2115 RepID=UPI000F028BFD|nr:carbohydrate ABC transporter permease [Mycoplasmopsis fermentans]